MQLLPNVKCNYKKCSPYFLNLHKHNISSPDFLWISCFNNLDDDYATGRYLILITFLLMIWFCTVWNDLLIFCLVITRHEFTHTTIPGDSLFINLPVLIFYCYSWYLLIIPYTLPNMFSSICTIPSAIICFTVIG